MLTNPWKCTVLHCNHLGNTWKPQVLYLDLSRCPLLRYNLRAQDAGADDLTLASARAIIKVSGHQHQWFPGVSQVVTM